MSETSHRRGGTALAVVLLVLLAAASGLALAYLAGAPASSALADLRSAFDQGGLSAALAEVWSSPLLPWLLVPTLGPLLVAALLVLVGSPRRGERPAGPALRPVPPAAPVPGPAQDPAAYSLRLLATLQEEARLLDFVYEDIEAYSDEQVGAAVRGIHASLRKAISERLVLEPVLAGEEGEAVEVPASLGAAAVRVTGRPGGGPPFRGALRHPGWRVTEAHLPEPTPGTDATILAPAEVEVDAE